MAYVATWVAVGAAVAGTLVMLLADGEHEVSLPPVQQTELALAADRADCRLRRGPQQRWGRPPIEGPRGVAARPATYTEPVAEDAIIAAMRTGTVVIHYRPGLAEEDLEALEELREAVPRGTILTPNEEMPYAVAATAWRRLLGCRELDRSTIDALQLFRGRYVGQGPETPR